MSDIIKKQIGDGWYSHLSPFFGTEDFKKIFETLQKNAGKYSPAGPNVFKAFELCKWEDVKVVIINDQPSDVSNGLAYGTVEETFVVLPETEDFLKKIEMAYDKLLVSGFDYTMESYAKQGILLLNQELTYIKNIFGPNPVIWRAFADFVIEKLNKEKTGLIWALWNPNVFHISKKINLTTHHLIMDELKSDHFLVINEILNKQNGETGKIKWC